MIKTEFSVSNKINTPSKMKKSKRETCKSTFYKHAFFFYNIHQSFSFTIASKVFTAPSHLPSPLPTSCSLINAQENELKSRNAWARGGLPPFSPWRKMLSMRWQQRTRACNLWALDAASHARAFQGDGHCQFRAASTQSVFYKI